MMSKNSGYDVPVEHRISKGQRQELQRMFELGQRILANEPDKAHEAARRFQYCVENDARNRIYIEAFLQSLEIVYPAPPPTKKRWFDRQHSHWKSACRAGDLKSILARGPTLLARNPWDAAVLLSMVQACHEFGYLEAALRYLQNAIDSSDHRIEAHRQYARTLAWTGRFSTASACWSRVLELDVNDSEARQMQQMLGVLPSETAGDAVAPPANVDSCLELARQCADRKDFDSAHHLLAHANTLAAGHLPTQDMAEAFQLEQADHRLDIARRLHEAAPSPATHQLLDDYTANQRRVALEVFNARTLRYPRESIWRLELARVLRSLEKVDQAIVMLAEIPTADVHGAAARLEEGECHQLQLDFSAALACYRDASQCESYGSGDDGSNEELRRRISQRLVRLQDAMSQ